MSKLIIKDILHHDIAEILLKLSLNTNQIINTSDSLHLQGKYARAVIIYFILCYDIHKNEHIFFKSLNKIWEFELKTSLISQTRRLITRNTILIGVLVR